MRRPEHIKRLDRILVSPDIKTKPRNCEIMRVLIGKLDRIILEFSKTPAINAAMVCIFQKIEHQEIVCYGCLRERAAARGSQILGIPWSGYSTRRKALTNRSSGWPTRTAISKQSATFGGGGSAPRPFNAAEFADLLTSKLEPIEHLNISRSLLPGSIRKRLTRFRHFGIRPVLPDSPR